MYATVPGFLYVRPGDPHKDSGLWGKHLTYSVITPVYKPAIIPFTGDWSPFIPFESWGFINEVCKFSFLLLKSG